jgi:hypothetical protein
VRSPELPPWDRLNHKPELFPQGWSAIQNSSPRIDHQCTPPEKQLNLGDSNFTSSTAHRLTSAQTRSDKQRAQSTIQRLTTYDTQSGVAKGILPGCNLRSNCRCSCPAVRMTTRILLRPSSTHEPSDPPRRVHNNHTFCTRTLPSQGATKANEQCHNTVSANCPAGPSQPVSPPPPPPQLPPQGQDLTIPNSQSESGSARSAHTCSTTRQHTIFKSTGWSLSASSYPSATRHLAT